MTGGTLDVSAPPPAGTAPVAVISAPPANALKIKTLRICDFRAFAGPEPVTIVLNSKNLLVYGENGAGKSSIFHALNEFFSIERADAAARKTRLADLRNKFSGLAPADGYIEVELDDGKPAARWDHARHPVDITPASDPRIVNGAYRKAILDYRALLDTNYRHGAGEVNLFDICVRVLLRDYPAVYAGKPARLFDLWRRLDGYLGRKQLRAREISAINALTASFNQGLRDALDQLRPKVDLFLVDLGWDDLKLTGLTTPGLTYNNAKTKAARAFNGRRVVPELTFRTLPISVPQTFLNEARLSALALAIYFAGRTICAATLQPDTPRLMVLDDVLIGLDQSNRLPVLDLLANHFRDWQVILLTYDRVWFEMARAYHRKNKADKFWNYARVHSNDDPTSSPTVTTVGSSAASEALDDARSFLKAGHINAAGNYARIATELALREFCETKKVQTAYQQQPDKTPASELLNAAKAHSTTKCSGHYDPPLAAIDMYSSILLNQLSHGGVPTVTQHEVQGAINAVDTLLFAVKVVPTGAAKPGSRG